MGVLICVFTIEMVIEAVIKNLYYVLVSGYPVFCLSGVIMLSLQSQVVYQRK